MNRRQRIGHVNFDLFINANFVKQIAIELTSFEK